MKQKRLVVSDSSSLILLAKADMLRETGKIFRIIIPQKVFEETVVKGKELKKEDAFRIETCVGKGIEIHGIKESPKVKELAEQLGIGKGEEEAFHLYFNKNADLLLTDDRQAIKLANLLGINWSGVPNIVLLLYKMGLSDHDASLEKMSLLEKYGRYKLEYIVEMKKKLGEKHAKK